MEEYAVPECDVKDDCPFNIELQIFTEISFDFAVAALIFVVLVDITETVSNNAITVNIFFHFAFSLHLLHFSIIIIRYFHFSVLFGIPLPFEKNA